jgi:hypothetical protein
MKDISGKGMAMRVVRVGSDCHGIDQRIQSWRRARV